MNDLVHLPWILCNYMQLSIHEYQVSIHPLVYILVYMYDKHQIFFFLKTTIISHIDFTYFVHNLFWMLIMDPINDVLFFYLESTHY